MNWLPRKWKSKFIRMFIVAWLALLLYLYFTLSSGDILGRKSAHQQSIIARLMQAYPFNDSKYVYRPLDDIKFPKYQTLSFYHLPKRHCGLMFTEVTSANRDTAYPLAPDFTFHLQYSRTNVVLYEDYGPGCVHRVFLFPVLPTHADLLYKMTASDLRNSFISFVIDGTEFKYGLEQFMLGEKWPFLNPFNTRHRYLASGMGSYMSLCYSHSMKISYIPSDPLPNNLFQLTINCSRHDLYCPVHIYSSVSRIKFPTGAKVESFASDEYTYKATAELIATMLNEPEHHQPVAVHDNCHLQCVKVCRGCRRIVFSQRRSGVVSSVLMRVYDLGTGKLRSNWNDILFSASFDGRHQMIDHIMLGSLFGATASLNEFGAAALGKKKLKCEHHNTSLPLLSHEVTGYFSYPMPFWKSIELSLDGTDFLNAPLLVCYQVHVVPNFYSSLDTGYLHIEKSYFSDNVTGYRQLLSVTDSWGQVVGMMMEIDNLRPLQGTMLNERWAALQSDVVMFIDGVQAASVLGTGLEDYFSYAHGFNMAENTTYAFVGNYHASPLRKEPLTWHCYRLHIADPIYFSESIELIMEGTSEEYFQIKQPGISHQEYVKRQQEGKGCLSHLVIYYASGKSGLTLTDTLHLAASSSETEHELKIQSSFLQDKSPEFFLRNKRYLGACNKNETFDFRGRSFSAHGKITFTMKTVAHNKGVMLRRKFHSLPKVSWNELGRIWLDDTDLGIWFIPMGTLSEQYCIRQEDFTIGLQHTRNRTRLTFTIEPVTEWRDISYSLFSII